MWWALFGIAAFVILVVSIVSLAQLKARAQVERDQARKSVKGAKRADAIMGEALPADPDGAVDLLRKR